MKVLWPVIYLASREHVISIALLKLALEFDKQFLDCVTRFSERVANIFIKLTHSYIILKNGQTYFKNLAV